MENRREIAEKLQEAIDQFDPISTENIMNEAIKNNNPNHLFTAAVLVTKENAVSNNTGKISEC